MAFGYVGISLEFRGEGENEVAVVVACKNPEYQVPVGKEVIAIDKRYFRPTEVDLLIGDPTKANTVLGWKPKHTLQDLVTDMMQSDLELFKKDLYLKKGGHEVKNYFE
jgi:GDPmannose 4,6-dehydratase